MKIIKKEYIDENEIEEYQLYAYSTLIAIYNLYVFNNYDEEIISSIIDSFRDSFLLNQNNNKVDNKIFIDFAKEIMTKYNEVK